MPRTTQEATPVTTRLNPYLSFRDNAREAMDFYQSVFGGELTRNTFADFQASEDPAEQDKIMHSMLVTKNGLVFMEPIPRATWSSSRAAMRCP